MIGKCKISYEYVQYDGTNHTEVELFIKQRECTGNFKMNTCVGSLKPSGIKSFQYKIYDPALVKEKDMEWISLFEGQYLVWNPKSKQMLHLNISDFKNTYEEDFDNPGDYDWLTDEINKNTPIQYPQKPYDTRPWPEYDPHNFQVWCNAGSSGHVVKDPSKVVSSSQLPPNKEWVYGKPGIIDKKK